MTDIETSNLSRVTGGAKTGGVDPNFDNRGAASKGNPSELPRPKSAAALTRPSDDAARKTSEL